MPTEMLPDTQVYSVNPPLTQVLNDEAESTLKQAPEAIPRFEAARESCLVQIYPPDVVSGMMLIEDTHLMIGRELDADIILPDASVSRRHAELVQSPQGFLIRDLGSTNGTLVNGARVKETYLSTGDTIRIGSFLFKFLSAGSIETQYHETVYSALTRDALTGALNKRYLLDAMQREIARSWRQMSCLSTVMLDIDHFKNINDTHGHLVGDEVLREFAARVLSCCREDDMLARYGGEEFCLLLCGTEKVEAMKFAERVRESIAAKPFETLSGPLKVTASLGVSCFDPAQIKSPHTVAPTDLLQSADQVLYEAKRAGRNIVRG